MLAKRIIPCLDVRDGRTVKGVNFIELTDAGDPIELAARYAAEGADELLFLDITASYEKRKTMTELVLKVAREVNIPFTVGGGVGSVSDAAALLQAGADKVSLNSAALKNPKLISDIAERFGSQCVVIAIDAKLESDIWSVYLNGGRIQTERNLFDWAKTAENHGAGELLFTSMNHDGTKNGFANNALKKLSEIVNIPVIASGGAGSKAHFADAFLLGNADAALAASVFHYGLIGISELKHFLKNQNIIIR
ncbi:MAG: imidazole glycerol phosphate synthase subunit HisF [Bacteroidetes bacterium HGW-Bacteroidetes-1]|jgi:cyclase|nr:MAG: imidazole glycerol phosphate synthase subunit HisF [Bacteroidetes bacterium HGW-Bacteroidetes-1]